MEPIFFGPDEQLFGCFHPAADGRSREAGVLLLYPAFGEYIQQHRAFFGLAARLSKRGFSTLRFDYFGTGDSAGRLQEARLARWLDDARTGLAELRRLTSCRSFVLFGSRMGGLLAVRVAAENPAVAAIALWDPIPDGKAYLRELETRHAEGLDPYDLEPTLTDGAQELLGFPVSSALRDDLEKAKLATARPFVDQKVLVLTAPEHIEATRRALGASLPRVWFRAVSYPDGWLHPLDGIYDVLVPAASIRATARWIDEQAG